MRHFEKFEKFETYDKGMNLCSIKKFKKVCERV